MTVEQLAIIEERAKSHYHGGTAPGCCQSPYGRLLCACNDIHILVEEVWRLQPFEDATRKFCNDESSGYDTLASADVDALRALCEYPKRDATGRLGDDD